MQVHRIYTFSHLRNFSYLIEDGDGGAYCVDPFDAQQIIPLLKKYNLNLLAIINTHEHFDHTCGNAGLLAYSQCPVLGPVNADKKIKEMTEELPGETKIDLAEGYLQVIDIPGHTLSHLGLLLIEGKDQCTHKIKAFFSGDTLFNGGVGRCGNGGDPHILYKTMVDKIFPLQDHVLLYPGHDYYENNLKFTLNIEPKNQDALELLESFKSSCSTKCVTNLGMERKVNTFFRLKNQTIRKYLDAGQQSDKKVFLELRKKRDVW